MDSSATSTATRKSMQSNRGRNSTPELALRSLLHRRGLRFFAHRRPVPGLRCEADIVFPRARVAVFVDGCFWHCCPDHGTWPVSNGEWWRAKLGRNAERDHRNNVQLAEAGWTVVRVWEHERPERAAELVAQAVQACRESRAAPG
jgi:DNA mismatch endonuclease (patch repair protein)